MPSDTANPFHGLSHKELMALAEKIGTGMAVLTVASGSEGAGKSTMAAHLAIQAQRAGVESVVMADTAARGPLAAWWNRRTDPKPPLSSLGGAAQVSEALGRLREMKHKLCIVNTPPTIDDQVEQLLEVSDLVVIPCRPSRRDLPRADQVAEVTHMLGRKSVFVVSAATIGARMSEAIAVELAKHGTVSPVTIHRRSDFVEAMERGKTVMELDPRGDSAREMEQLWQYVYELLKKNIKFNI
jgi:chromosome partitioning protein